MEGYQWGEGREMGEKVQRIRSIIHRYKIDWGGRVKNSMGNGEAKEHICTTHGHELRGGMLVGGGFRAEKNKGEK